MFIVIIFFSCLLCTLSSGQTSNTITSPTVGPVYPVRNNDSLLNFTFVYPANYQFDKLYVRFTVYDFINNDKLNPQPYAFSWANFTNSNTSLPWVIPTTMLQPGDYVIACFEWVQKTNNDTLLMDVSECILTRATMNSTLLSVAAPIISTPMVMNNSAMVSVYFPQVLPYDQVNITANLNGVIAPTMGNASSNETFSKIAMFSFTNLMMNTRYNMCIIVQFGNSKINGSYQMDSDCQTIMTFGGNSSNTTLGGNSSNMSTFNFLMILLSIFIVAFI